MKRLWLKKYLACEKILRSMFDSLEGYCPHDCNPSVGCCGGNLWRLDFKEKTSELEEYLYEKRVEKYGEPTSVKDLIFKQGCWYLKNNRCTLKTHKPVACISLICYSNKLKQEYGVEYDLVQIAGSLKKILNKSITRKKLKQFIKYLKSMRDEVKNKKSNKKSIISRTIQLSSSPSHKLLES